MLRIASAAAVFAVAALLGAAPGQAAPADATAVEIFAQQADPAIRQRPRTRLRVTPLYPRRPYHSLDPLPYGIDYPGPNAVRQCSFRLVQEYRPSGTVIVPRQRCWWVPGYR